MSELELSTRTKSLLASARGDSPGAAAKAKIWSGVAIQTGVGGPGGSSPGSAPGPTGGAGAATATSAKMLAVGTLLGSAVTVGLALVMMRIAPAPETTKSAAHPASLSVPISASAPQIPPQIPITQDVHHEPPVARPPKPRNTAHRVEVADGDPLMQEASFVAEARAALARGDAAGALRSVRAARQSGSHQLAPEEASLESQALAAVGR